MELNESTSSNNVFSAWERVFLASQMHYISSPGAIISKEKGFGGSVQRRRKYKTLDDIVHFYYYLRLYIDYYERKGLEDEYNFDILHTKFNIIIIA